VYGRDLSGAAPAEIWTDRIRDLQVRDASAEEAIKVVFEMVDEGCSHLLEKGSALRSNLSKPPTPAGYHEVPLTPMATWYQCMGVVTNLLRLADRMMAHPDFVFVPARDPSRCGNPMFAEALNELFEAECPLWEVAPDLYLVPLLSVDAAEVMKGLHLLFYVCVLSFLRTHMVCKHRLLLFDSCVVLGRRRTHPRVLAPLPAFGLRAFADTFASGVSVWSVQLALVNTSNKSRFKVGHPCETFILTEDFLTCA
jgi:hypothetical protein